MFEHAALLAAIVGLCAAAMGDPPGPAGRRADFHVAVGGNDDWSGKLPAPRPGGGDGPFATLGRARDAVRDARRKGLKGDLTVLVRGGRYRLTEPLVFTPADGGTPEHAVTYAAWSGETPVFTGGRVITGWKKSATGLWTAELPEVKAGTWHFSELFVNGRRRRRARAPNSGFFRVVAAGADNRTSFTFRQGDLHPCRDPGDAEIVFLHDWSISRVRIREVDEKTRTVTLTDPIGSAASHYRITHFEPHPRYFVENAPELLDQPGEWHLDRRTGVLSYWPEPGEDMTRAEVVAPAIERLLEVAGDGAKGRFVENLHFVGLCFAHCAWPRPAHGYAAGQAGFHDVRTAETQKFMRARMPAAVDFRAARRCRFADGRIEHVGGTGISLGAWCRGNRIVGNVIADVAGNGVMVGETSQDPDSLARDNAVSNNYIHHCGEEFYGCVGVWVGITAGTLVTHNEICHLPYTGVSVGWCWNTRPTPCRDNRVEFNHIHHVMQLLSDGGGIYTLGRQPGTVLRGNVIHDVPANAGRAESNGMFIDEGSSMILIEGNTIHSVARAPIRFHKATGDTIRRNTLVTAGKRAPFVFNACREDAMTYEDNTILQAGASAAPAGRVGAALRCDGVGASVDVPHASALEPKQLTVEAWVKLSAWPTGDDARRWIVNKNHNEWQQGHYGLVINRRDVGAYLNIGGGRENCHAAFGDARPLTLNRWHHLAMTYDGSVLKVYADGRPAASKAVGKPRIPAAGQLSIGKRQDGYSHFAGLIDEVRLYARALSAEEIAARRADPKAVPKDDKDLVRHWGFDDLPRAADLYERAPARAGPEPPYRRRLLGNQ